MPKVQEPKFRVNRKKFGLTYSALTEGDVRQPIQSCEELKDFLETKGLMLFTICKELHENGLPHFHAHVAYDVVIQTENVRFFDFKGIHPNILLPGPAWENYVRKKGEFITNRNSSPYARALQSTNLHDALELLKKEVPKDMFNNGHNIEKNAMKFFAKPKKEAPVYYGPYPASYYPSTWDPETHALLLWGKPNTCKTNFAKYLFGEYEYVKARVESLKVLTFEKPFIFDEVYLIDEKPMVSREITSVQDGGEIPARYGDISIPPGVPRIFISNLEHPFLNPEGSVYDRRVISHQIL